MSLYTCKAHNMSGPTPCCQFASRVTGVEYVSTTSASTTPPTATAREAELRKPEDLIPHTVEYIAAMQAGVAECLVLEEAAYRITPARALVFAHRLNEHFQRAQAAFKANQLRDEERDYAYNVGVTDGRATEREAAGERVKALRREQIVPGDLIPFAWNAALDRAVSAITNATEGT